jgi:hypothetical protein
MAEGNGNGTGEDGSSELTLTREELGKLIAAEVSARESAAAREAEGEDVKAIRKIVREEAAEAFKVALAELLDPNAGGEPKGGAPKGQEQ